jgi:hypothetical protein
MAQRSKREAKNFRERFKHSLRLNFIGVGVRLGVRMWFEFKGLPRNLPSTVGLATR